MNNFTKNIILPFIRYSGIVFLFREIINRNKITIITFHDWDINTADLAFKYYLKKYNVINLNDFIEASLKKNKNLLPPKSLIITIDDGKKDNFELLPLIQKYNLPITIFLTSGIIDTHRKYWFNIKHPNFLTSELKLMSNIEKLEKLEEVGFLQQKDYPNRESLNKEEIMKMKPYVNFQSHTVFHPCLNKCDDSEANFEIFESKKNLEKEYNLEINALAFPNGDYSDREISISKDAEYQCCLTSESGLNDLNSNLYKLKRLGYSNEFPIMTELIVFTSGAKQIIYGKIKNFLKLKR